MEALLLEAFMIQSRTMVNTFKELEPFLNIDEQSGFFCYRIIITLKTLFVLHAIETAIPKTWSLASIIIGKFYVAYMNPIVMRFAVIGFILHVLGLFTPQMTMMGVISMDYKSYEFLLDIYVLLCSLYYAVQAYKGEIKKLTIVLFMLISIGSCVNDANPLPFSLYTYCVVIVFYMFTIFTLIPNRPENSHRMMYFYVVLYLLIFFKMGQHYDKSKSSASQTNSSDVCMKLQNNFKAEHCGLIEALENQEEIDFSKSLNMSDCVGYDAQKPLDVQMKNFRKKTVFKNIADVKRERTEGEYKLYPNATCASVNIKPDDRAYIQKVIDATPAKKVLIETAKKEDKELELIDKNETYILNFGTEERNNILKQDYAELRQEPFIQDFIQMNEDPMKHEKRLSGNMKLTETKDTYSNNDQWNRSDKCLVKESSVEYVRNIKKRLGNLKTPKGDELSAGTDQENLVCKIRENNSVNFDESINYSSFISKQERGRKEIKNELEENDCDAAGIEPEEFMAQDNDAGNVQSENAHHSQIQATEAEAFLSERYVFDANEYEVILSNALANDYSTEAYERVTKPLLKVAVGAENTKPTILPGELETEPEALEANKGAVIEASESERFLSEVHAYNPIDSDDPGAKDLEITKASDLGMRKLEPTTAEHPGVNEREPSKVGNIKSIQTQEIKARKPEADETEQFEPKKGKVIYVNEAEVILSTTLFVDHQSEAAQGTTQAGKHEIPASQATEAGDTGATRESDFQAPKSNNASTIEPQASELDNGEIETPAAQANSTRASESVEDGTTEAGQVDAQLKTIKALEAYSSKVSDPGQCEFEPTNATDPSATQLQSTNANKASATVLQRSESADTEGNEPQATEADDRGATKSCETGTSEADKAEPAKISDLGASEHESIKTSSHGATKHEPSKTSKGQKKQTKADAAHKGKASDAIEAKVLSAEHPSETGEREAAAFQASNAGETEATEIQVAKPNEANAIDTQSGDINDIEKSNPKATQAKSSKANETGEAGTIKSGEIEATDHKTSQDRVATPANAIDPGPIKLEPSETIYTHTSESLVAQAIAANTTKSQAAHAKEAEERETGTAEVGETEDNEPKATQFRKSEPDNPSDPCATELQTTNSKEIGANESQGSEAGGIGGTELQAAQSDEGREIEASEAEPAKGSDPESSELEPNKTGEAANEETEIYKAHKGKAIDDSEDETILSIDLSKDHQSKAGELETATSQATDTGDTGATELQATKPNGRNAIESQANEVGNIGRTKPKVAEANKARASETGESGTIDAFKADATDPKTSEAREAEPEKDSYQGPIKLEPTKVNDSRTTECLAIKTIKAIKSQADTEVETTEPKETQTREVELAKYSDTGSNKFQDTDSNDASETVQQGIGISESGTTELQATKSNKANVIKLRVSEDGKNGEIDLTAAQAVEARESETVEAGTTGAVEINDTDPKLIQELEAHPSKLRFARLSKLEHTKATDPSTFQLQVTETNEASQTILQRRESADTEVIEPQATEADKSGATEVCETDTTGSDKVEPAKISELGANKLRITKTSCLGATKNEPTKFGKAQKRETKVYSIHRDKATDAIKAKTLSADHPSETGERAAAASQASNSGETEATEIQATKPKEANAIEPQAGWIGNIGKPKPKAAQAKSAKAGETGETRTIETGEVEATDHKTSQDREAESANASDPRQIKLEPTDTMDPHTSESLATQAIEANKSQAAQAKKAEGRETGTDEVGEAEANDPKAIQSRKAEPVKSSDPGATELQTTNSKETGASVLKGSEAGGTGAIELQAAQADEGGAIETSEAEPAKVSNSGASELKPTKTAVEAEKEETEIYEAHKGKAIDASEAETISSKALSEDHQSKAGEREAAAFQAIDTGDIGTTELQATKHNGRNAIDSQASEVGNIGETKPKVAEANESRTSETGETGTIDAFEAEAADPKTSEAREAEPEKDSYRGPIKLEPTKANDSRTTECLATKTIESNTVKPETTQAEASEARTTEIGEVETTEPKETQSGEAELAMFSDSCSNELEDAESNEASATVPQRNETDDSGRTELQAAQIEAGESGKTEAGKDEPVKGNDPGASEPQLAPTGEAEEKETGVYEAQKGGNVEIWESNEIFKARKAIAAGASESQNTEICEIGASQVGGTAATESKRLRLASVEQLG